MLPRATRKLDDTLDVWDSCDAYASTFRAYGVRCTIAVFAGAITDEEPLP